MDIQFLSSPEFVVLVIGAGLFIVPRLIPAIRDALGLTGILAIALLLIAGAVGSFGTSVSAGAADLLGAQTQAFLW